MLNNLPKVTQLAKDIVRIRTWATWLQNPNSKALPALPQLTQTSSPLILDSCRCPWHCPLRQISTSVGWLRNKHQQHS